MLAERARFPRDKPCAEALSPEALKDLAELGVLEAVAAAGAVRLSGFRVISDDGRDVRGHYANTRFARGGEFGYALPRATLDPLLLGAARRAGAHIMESTALEHLAFERGRVAG